MFRNLAIESSLLWRSNGNGNQEYELCMDCMNRDSRQFSSRSEYSYSIRWVAAMARGHLCPFVVVPSHQNYQLPTAYPGELVN